MMRRMQDEAINRMHHDFTRALERKGDQEQDTDLQNTPPPLKRGAQRSPTSARASSSSWAGAQVIDEEKDGDGDDQGTAGLVPF